MTFGIHCPGSRQSRLCTHDTGVSGIGTLGEVLLGDEASIVALKRGNLDVVAAAPAADDRTGASENISVARIDGRDFSLHLRNLPLEPGRLVFEKLGSAGCLLQVPRCVEL